LEFLADTVSIVRHFSRIGRIGERAKSLLQSADRGENKIAVSIMSVTEILYLSEGRRIPLNLAQFTEKMFALTNYRMVDIDLAVILEAQNVRGLELHDRIIVSTARVLGVPIITPDEQITDSGLVEVIWK
jgi:PIN domain nuclease of toxin-antitoxin system